MEFKAAVESIVERHQVQIESRRKVIVKSGALPDCREFAVFQGRDGVFTVEVGTDTFTFENYETLVAKQRGISREWENIIAATATGESMGYGYILAWNLMATKTPRNFDVLLSERLSVFSAYNNLHAIAFAQLLHDKTESNITKALTRLHSPKESTADRVEAGCIALDLLEVVYETSGHCPPEAAANLIFQSKLARRLFPLALAFPFSECLPVIPARRVAA